MIIRMNSETADNFFKEESVKVFSTKDSKLTEFVGENNVVNLVRDEVFQKDEIIFEKDNGELLYSTLSELLKTEVGNE